MELYEINIHFPDIYRMLENKTLTLKNTDYYNTPEEAVEKAKLITNAFVTPIPDFWYVEDCAGLIIWTNNAEKTKRVIKYEIIINKPIIHEIQNY